MEDSLYRNSLYLMLGTGVMSVLGFIAWAIISRLYTAEQVGLATTIISVMGIITGFSVLGLNTGLIRFLPKSKRKNDKINTAFTLASLVTIVVTAVFLLGLKGFSPSLLFIKQNIFYSVIFILFMVFSTLSTLLDGVFVSYRASGYVLLKNTIFSTLKLIFPFFFVFLGAYGIFGSWMLSLIVSFLINGAILTFKFSYRPKFVFYDSIIEQIGKYSFGNYVAGFLGSIAAMLLPIIITNLHHPEFTAYYYISMMIASVLFIIPQATTNSLFAEGSNNVKEISIQVRKAIRIIFLLLVPAIIITILVGKYVLLFFGQNYAEGGFSLLVILAISGVFVSINAVYSAILRVRKEIGKIVLANLVGAVITLVLSYFLILYGKGLQGVGYAWLIGQILILGVYLLSYRRTRN